MVLIVALLLKGWMSGWAYGPDPPVAEEKRAVLKRTPPIDFSVHGTGERLAQTSGPTCHTRLIR